MKGEERDDSKEDFSFIAIGGYRKGFPILAGP